MPHEIDQPYPCRGGCGSPVNHPEGLCWPCHRKLEGYNEPSGTGSPNSNGIAGAPSPLMTASGWRDPRQIVVSRTPDDGSNTYQGQMSSISWRLKEGPEGAFTLTVSFDSETRLRLLESLYSLPGNFVTGGTAYCRMTVTLEPPTT